ncbi:hypothetical protein PR202_ga11138 [Eleusine coracana subsp. coracana]|uniref:Gnk2-homologous domain-containing protein n=1 Tax=Eleusine coracana subsp. coracana TaxID=191504 RepID=A0AAV5C8L2_ELECO|nr:hypothetical protein PR202_ga11138 [Eleusine coracana subsp. coracana]
MRRRRHHPAILFLIFFSLAGAAADNDNDAAADPAILATVCGGTAGVEPGCMAYLSPTACQLCYARSRVKLPHCLPATAGRIFLDGCFLRYGGGHQGHH